MVISIILITYIFVFKKLGVKKGIIMVINKKKFIACLSFL